MTPKDARITPCAAGALAIKRAAVGARTGRLPLKKGMPDGERPVSFRFKAPSLSPEPRTVSTALPLTSLRLHRRRVAHAAARPTSRTPRAPRWRWGYPGLAPLPRRLAPLVAVLGLAPFALVTGGSRALVPRIGDAVARAAVEWVPTPCPVDRAPVPSAQPPALQTSTAPAPVASERAVSRRPLGAPSSPRKRVSSAARLVIGVDRVSALTANQLRAVHWANVADAQGRAAGVRLSGVGGLGVGLADGDVVTSINGRPTRTDEEAISAGTSAWSSGVRWVEATIARGGAPLLVTLHLPAR
jgi:hypothetical protein